MGFSGRQGDAAEEGEQQRESYQPELCECLKRQRVGVLGRIRDRPVAQPPDRPAAGPHSTHRLRPESADRHAPVVVAIALQRHETGRSGAERPGRALLGADHDRECQPRADHRKRDQRRSARQPQRRSSLAPGQPPRRDRSGERDHYEQRQRDCALPLAAGVSSRQRGDATKRRGCRSRQAPGHDREHDRIQLLAPGGGDEQR